MGTKAQPPAEPLADQIWPLALALPRSHPEKQEQARDVATTGRQINEFGRVAASSRPSSVWAQGCAMVQQSARIER
jgi:hypothetical protein